MKDLQEYYANFDSSKLLSKNSLEFMKQLSKDSYLDPSLFGPINNSKVMFFRHYNSDGEAYLILTENKNILVFRGTEGFNFKDWMTNLKFIPSKTPYGYIHSGFLNGFKHLWKEIKPNIDHSKSTIITGHSLGGALAHVCALYFKEETGQYPNLLVTFGQPRIGFFQASKFTKNILDEKYIRIVRIRDLIARVPPWWLCYKHPENSGYKRLGNGRGVRLSFFERHIWNFVVFLIIAAVAYFTFIDHNINTY